MSLSEAEVLWRAFLTSLKDRGLNGIELIASDAHVGLQAARKAVFPSVPWQRCQFHLQQNAGQYVPSVSMRIPVTRVARLFPNEASCLRLVSAVLMELAEGWQTADKRYVTFGEECAVEG